MAFPAPKCCLGETHALWDLALHQGHLVLHLTESGCLGFGSWMNDSAQSKTLILMGSEFYSAPDHGSHLTPACHNQVALGRTLGHQCPPMCAAENGCIHMQLLSLVPTKWQPSCPGDRNEPFSGPSCKQSVRGCGDKDTQVS